MLAFNAQAQHLPTSKASAVAPRFLIEAGSLNVTPRKNLILQTAPKRTQAKQSTSTLQASTVCGNLVSNGYFDDNNFYGYSGYIQNVSSSASTLYNSDELPSWIATNFSTPDYYNKKAPTGSQSNPVSASAGSFTPFSGDGAIGLVGTNETQPSRPSSYMYSEYVTQQLAQPLSSAHYYYASLRAANAPVCQYATGIGVYITTSNPRDDSQKTYYNPGLTIGYVYSTVYTPSSATTTPAGCGIPSSGVIASSQWTTVSGIFKGVDNASYVNVGNFQPSTKQLIRASASETYSYTYVDDVEVFEIPEAGPAPSACVTGAVTIGQGCDIPGATYSWTTSSNNTPFATTIQTTVTPTVTTTYTLTVTLPNNSTFASMVTLTVSAAPGLITGNNDYAAGRHTAEIDPVSGATSYNWYRGGTLNTTNYGTSAIWIIPRNGCGGTNVSVEAVYACGTSAKRTQYFPAENCGTRARTAYPSPASESIAMPEGTEDATILNAQGKPLLQLGGARSFDVRHLPDGLYNLQMRQNGKLVNQRIEIKH